MTPIRPDPSQRPIAIGAIGGSGSRVLAEIVRGAGVSIGANLNTSCDNLEFTARFKSTEILALPDQSFLARLAEFEALSLTQMQQAGKQRWGWKEPNTHVVVDRILNAYPHMRYVHLLRSGFDMALSRNQNQPRLWGPAYLGGALSKPPTPREILAYFVEVHRRVLALAQRPQNQGRVLIVEYEALCADPKAEIARLLDFLHLTPDEPLDDLARLVRRPDTIGRGRALGLEPFAAADLEYIRSHLPSMMPTSSP